jgi:hypothetical protein
VSLCFHINYCRSIYSEIKERHSSWNFQLVVTTRWAPTVYSASSLAEIL